MQTDDLHHTYLLLKRPALLQPLVDIFSAHVTVAGQAKLDALDKPYVSNCC